MTVKKTLLRGLIGIPLGVFISSTINVLFIIFSRDAYYYIPLSPNITRSITAVLPIAPRLLSPIVIQYFLSGILGFIFLAGSAVWQTEKWSITKQTFIHFLITSLTIYPIFFIGYQIITNVFYIIGYFIIFAIIYFVIWVIMFKYWKNKINALNKKLNL